MAPKTSKQFEEIRQKSQQKIETVAFELFAKRGYTNTSISQIAKAAEISKGLLYNYYDSKEDLLLRLIEHAIEEAEHALEAFHAENLPATERIRLIAESSITMVKANPQYWQFMTALALQSDVAEQIAPLVRKKTDMALQAICPLFEELGYENPQLEAFAFGALLDGLMLHFISLGSAYPLEEMKDYILKKYLNSDMMNPIKSEKNEK